MMILMDKEAAKPTLNEQDLLELYALRKSQLPDYRDVVSFERVEIRDMWIKYGYEKVRDALRAIGLNGWRMRMLSKILDGSVDPDPKPTWIDDGKTKTQPPPPARLSYHVAEKDDVASNAETRKVLGEALRKMNEIG